jgi:hypothetical protein
MKVKTSQKEKGIASFPQNLYTAKRIVRLFKPSERRWSCPCGHSCQVENYLPTSTRTISKSKDLALVCWTFRHNAVYSIELKMKVLC